VITGLRSQEISDHIDQVRYILAIGRAEYRAEHGHDVDVSIRREDQPPVR
jgi:hypothetical protein